MKRFGTLATIFVSLIALALLMPAAPAAAAPSADEVKGGVVELRIYRPAHPELYGVASATIVNRYAQAVTQLHPLLGAERVEAYLPGVAQPLPVELLKIDPQLDLAMLQLTPHPLARASLKPLTVAEQMPAEDEMVYPVKLAGDTVTLTRMQVEGVKPYPEINRRLTSVLKHDPITNWIGLAGSIDRAMAGNPVLNEAGQVVGLTAWTWLTRGEAAVALSGEHLKQFTAQPPSTPITFAGLTPALQAAGTTAVVVGSQNTQVGMSLPRTTFPLLVGAEQSRANDLRQYVTLLSSMHQCPQCKGSGFLITRKLTGYRNEGALRYPVYENEEVECSRCQGTGLAKPEALNRAFAGLLGAMGTTDPRDAQSIEQVRRVETTMRQMVLDHPLSIQKMFNDQAVQLTRNGALEIGKPVIAMGDLVQEIELPGEAAKLSGLKIKLSRRDEVKILVDRPLLIGEGEQRMGIVGGILAGYVYSDAEEPPVAVIQRGFVIPIDEEKFEEAKDAAEKALEERRRAAEEANER